ncbi:DUF222 domain-containing protein [Saxibacter everestensis]|uniref:DUF222 domain-containing protein n=1 Tax=Saxibacter everestensis TaxID=2909229 RepID=A0ABY8QZ15_9MICO|nr:DUF222 domain-containing protein [Brevibacteriaceae bacterium ZFBP1038]
MDEADAGNAADVLAAARTLSGVLGRSTAAVVGGWDRNSRRTVLTTLDDLAGQIELHRSRVIAAEEKTRDWAADGEPNIASWLGRHSRTGYGKAKADLALARTLDELPAVGEALDTGQLSSEHARVISRQFEHASEVQRETLTSAQGQAELLQSAKHADAGAFGKALRQRMAGIDREKLQRDHDAVRQRRYARLSRRNGGVFLEALVDPLAGQYLETALNAASPRPAAGDERTRDQLCADALTTLAKTLLDHGDFKPGGHIRPHVMITLSREQWATWKTAPNTDSADPPAAPMADADRAAAGGSGPVMGNTVPIPPTELDLILCDSILMRAVLDADDQPINLGRDVRTFSHALRKALQLRDGHCAWPACGMPAHFTDGHHIDEWKADQGLTSIDNGILFCSFHHHRVHATGTIITSIPGGYRFTTRDGTPIGDHNFQQRHSRNNSGSGSGSGRNDSASGNGRNDSASGTNRQRRHRGGPADRGSPNEPTRWTTHERPRRPAPEHVTHPHPGTTRERMSSRHQHHTDPGTDPPIELPLE